MPLIPTSDTTLLTWKVLLQLSRGGICHRADTRLPLSQWETSLQSNAVSYWLGGSLESNLGHIWMAFTGSNRYCGKIINVLDGKIKERTRDTFFIEVLFWLFCQLSIVKVIKLIYQIPLQNQKCPFLYIREIDEYILSNPLPSTRFASVQTQQKPNDSDSRCILRPKCHIGLAFSQPDIFIDLNQVWLDLIWYFII